MTFQRGFLAAAVFCVAFTIAAAAANRQAPDARNQAPSQSQARAAAPISDEELARRKELFRTRVTELYKLFQIPSWRKAEAYLTEDSKDAYYEQSKGPILDFTIKTLEVSSDGLNGAATVEIKFMMPKFTQPFSLLRPTQWVYEQDTWFMKLEKKPVDPLGPMREGLPAESFKNAVLRFQRLEQEVARGNQEYVFRFTQAGKEELTVLALTDDCPFCLEARFDKASYAPGESGLLRVKTAADEKFRSTEYYIRIFVTPGNQWIILKLRLK